MGVREACPAWGAKRGKRTGIVSSPAVPRCLPISMGAPGHLPGLGAAGVWRSPRTRGGAACSPRRTHKGSGSPWTRRHGTAWRATSGIAATRGPNRGGRMGRQHIASRRRARRIKRPSPQGSCRRPTRKPPRSTPGNPILGSASRTRCGSCISRLVRDTLGFSTTLANPIGASTYCRCHDNLIRAAAFLV